MNDSNPMLKRMRAALERHPGVNLHTNPITLLSVDGLLTLNGEVEDIAAKRLVRRIAVELFGADQIRERLRVRPTEVLGDGAICDALRKRLMQERALRDLVMKVDVDGRQPPAEPSHENGSESIAISVNHGIATLRGAVSSLMMKRLLEVLVWWTAGVAGVENRLHVMPNETDNDDEISDAVRMVLEKDPSLDAGQISVRVTDAVVTLEGLVPGREHERMASEDVWYIPGVHGVVNHLKRRLDGANL